MCAEACYEGKLTNYLKTWHLDSDTIQDRRRDSYKKHAIKKWIEAKVRYFSCFFMFLQSLYLYLSWLFFYVHKNRKIATESIWDLY